MFENVKLPSNCPCGVIRYTVNPNGSDKIEVLNSTVEKIWELKKEVIETDSFSVWKNIDEYYVKKIKEGIYIFLS